MSIRSSQLFISFLFFPLNLKDKTVSQPDGFPLLTATVKYPLAGPVMMLPCRYDVSGVRILEKQLEKRVRVLGRDPLLEKIGGRSAGWEEGRV